MFITLGSIGEPLEASRSASHTTEETEDQRGWNLVRGYLADECLTSIHDVLKRGCISKHGCAGLREAGTRDLGVWCRTAC